MFFRWNKKRLSIWILLFLQLILILLFVAIKPESENSTLRTKVSFVTSKNTGKSSQNSTYHTSNSEIYLKLVNTHENYANFNTSLCFINGTDVTSMNRLKNSIWKCECLNGYHGNDCGQPEVIWRAFLAYRKPLTIKGPRKYQRRVIYVFEVRSFMKTLTDIKTNEFLDVIDLFVMYEMNQSNSDLKKYVEAEFLNKYSNKILFLSIKNVTKLWFSIKSVIKNINNDDLILTSDLNDIPNKLAVNFLKFYDNWPEPISFRLRWSVYGFFWIHPNKTLLKGGLCSVGYLRKALNSDISLLNSNKTISNAKGLKIGDLNHFGGWSCEFCVEESSQIIEMMYKNVTNQKNVVFPEKTIDTGYIEELIENGIYINGKTELLRARRYQEAYFAPKNVLENNWKYDFLLINLYSKLDYY